MRLIVGGKTDQGRIRANNEDHIYVNERLGLAVVADGVGGRASGETASRLAVKTLVDYFSKGPRTTPHYDSAYSETTNRLNAAVMEANRIVFEAAQSAPDLSGMGTTIAAAALAGNQLSFAHVGDSRIYLARSGSLEQLTDDHSFAQEQVNLNWANGKEPVQSVTKNVLTRAIGVQPEVRADLGELTVLSDDILLLCSDGLYNMVEDDVMLEIMSRAGNVRAASEILIDTANDNGGEDNISAVVCYFSKKKWYSSWSSFADAFRR